MPDYRPQGDPRAGQRVGYPPSRVPSTERYDEPHSRPYPSQSRPHRPSVYSNTWRNGDVEDDSQAPGWGQPAYSDPRSVNDYQQPPRYGYGYGPDQYPEPSYAPAHHPPSPPRRGPSPPALRQYQQNLAPPNGYEGTPHPREFGNAVYQQATHAPSSEWGGWGSAEGERFGAEMGMEGGNSTAQEIGFAMGEFIRSGGGFGQGFGGGAPMEQKRGGPPNGPQSGIERGHHPDQEQQGGASSFGIGGGSFSNGESAGQFIGSAMGFF